MQNTSNVIGLDRKKIKDFFLRKLPEMKEAVIDAIIEILPSVPHYQEESDHFTLQVFGRILGKLVQGTCQGLLEGRYPFLQERLRLDYPVDSWA